MARGALDWTFQFDLDFRSKIFANLTTNGKSHGPTKPDIKIINSINHYGNWVLREILCYPHDLMKMIYIYIYTHTYIYKCTGSFAGGVECSPMVQETGVQSQVESY